MIVFRSAQDNDLEGIHRLAQISQLGITSLPKNKDVLKKRLHHSSQSYKRDVLHPSNEYYLFVLEDHSSKKILGVSGIEAQIGFDAPFYSFKISKHTQMCHALNIRNDYELLTLVNDNQNCSEICTLFLDPEHRQKQQGVLLSKARFLFMAQHPQRFCDTVFAELCGVSDDQAQSPFWDCLGAHFFKMSFAETDQLALATSKQFIEDLMPRNPIYVPLLPPEAQAVIGKPHAYAVPAMAMLLKEGFRFNNCVDIFDAGPTIEVPRKHIRTIALSQVKIIKGFSDEVTGSEYLIANASIHFRATIHFALTNEEDDSCIISKEVAELLKVGVGDTIRLSPR